MRSCQRYASERTAASNSGSLRRYIRGGGKSLRNSLVSGGKPRIGIEIFLGVLLMIVGSVASMLLGTAVAITLSGHGMPPDPQRYLMSHPWPGLAVGMGIEMLIGAFGYRWIVKKTEMREPHELGGDGAFKELLEGAGVGIAFVTLVMLILSGLGVYTASGVSVNSGILLGLMMGLGAAFLEEPVFRGIMLRLLDKRYGATIAIALVSVIFGLMHTANGFVTGEFSYWGAVAIMVEAGVLLSAAYYFTKRLWFPIGLHAAWNFALAGIFGLRVSGIDTGRGLIQGSLNGPELLTGGSFGPEASLVTVALGMSLGLTLLFKARRKGNIHLQA